KSRGAKATGHVVDSFNEPTQAGAQTSSNMSQSQNCTPKHSRPYVREMRIIKAEMLATIGESHEHPNRFQLDHRIPLALGGATIDRRNLMLQPMAIALEKDAIERCLAVAVCDGRIGLDEARAAIWRDWRAAGAVCERRRANLVLSTEAVRVKFTSACRRCAKSVIPLWSRLAGQNSAMRPPSDFCW
ncbi:MAG: hypothetical protein FD172_4019, partial [Methylocystaceae bacterium]